MYCRHCGKEIPNGSAFCNHCGKNTEKSRSSDFGQSAAFRLCPDCGNSFPRTAKRCPKCGYEPDSEAARLKRNGRGKSNTSSASPFTAANDPHTNVKHDHFSLLNYIIGFRSRNPLHMVLASMYYLSAISTSFFNTYSIIYKLGIFLLLLSIPYIFAALLYYKKYQSSLTFILVGALMFFGGSVLYYFSPDDVDPAQLLAFETLTASEQTGPVDMELFNQIENNMSYKQVVDLIGEEGELMSSYGEGEYNTFVMKWDGSGSVGANVMVTFQNNVVVGKAQAGLK